MKPGGWKESHPHPLKNAALMGLFLLLCGPGCGAVVAVASGASAFSGIMGGGIFIGLVSLMVLPSLLRGRS